MTSVQDSRWAWRVRVCFRRGSDPTQETTATRQLQLTLGTDTPRLSIPASMQFGPCGKEPNFVARIRDEREAVRKSYVYQSSLAARIFSARSVATFFGLGT